MAWHQHNNISEKKKKNCASADRKRKSMAGVAYRVNVSAAASGIEMAHRKAKIIAAMAASAWAAWRHVRRSVSGQHQPAK